MKYRDCMIAWTPTTYPDLTPERAKGTIGQVEVMPHPDREDRSRIYGRTGGSCILARKKMPRWQQIALMFTDFHQMVVRDGIDPQVAHKAFLAIDEYRHTISPDIPGATYPEDEMA